MYCADGLKRNIFFHQGKEPWTLLHLGDQAASAPPLQTERDSVRPQQHPAAAVPLSFSRSGAEKWRSGENQIKHNLLNRWPKVSLTVASVSFCLCSCVSGALQGWKMQPAAGWVFCLQPTPLWTPRCRHGWGKATILIPVFRVFVWQILWEFTALLQHSHQLWSPTRINLGAICF